MKRTWMSKALAFILSLSMALSFCVPAYAGPEEETAASEFVTEAVEETEVEEPADEAVTETPEEVSASVEEEAAEPEEPFYEEVIEAETEEFLSPAENQETEPVPEDEIGTDGEDDEEQPEHVDVWINTEPGYHLFSDETSFRVSLDVNGEYDTVQWSVYLGKQTDENSETEKITEDLSAGYLVYEGASAQINVRQILADYLNDLPVSQARIIVSAAVFTDGQEIGSAEEHYEIIEPYCSVDVGFYENLNKIVQNVPYTVDSHIQAPVYNAENPDGNYENYVDLTSITSSDESIITGFFNEESQIWEITTHAAGTATLTFNYECQAYPEFNGSVTRDFLIVDREYRIWSVDPANNTKYMFPGEQKDFTIRFYGTVSTEYGAISVHELEEGDSFSYELGSCPEGCVIRIDPDDPLKFTLIMPETAGENEDVWLKATFKDSQGEVLSEEYYQIATASTSYYKTVFYDENNNPLNRINMTEGQTMVLRPELYLVTSDGETLCENVDWYSISGGGPVSVEDREDGTYLLTAMWVGNSTLTIWYTADGLSSEDSIPLIVNNGPIDVWINTASDYQLFSDESSFRVSLGATGDYDTVQWSVYLGKQTDENSEPEKITEDLSAGYLVDEGASAQINVRQILADYLNDMPVSQARIIVRAAVFSDGQEIGSAEYSYTVREPYCDLFFGFEDDVNKIVLNTSTGANSHFQCPVYNAEYYYGNYDNYADITSVSSSDESVITVTLRDEGCDIFAHSFGTATLTFTYECQNYPQFSGSFIKTFLVVDRNYGIEAVIPADNTDYMLPGSEKDFAIRIQRIFSTENSSDISYDIAEGDSINYELSSCPEGCELSKDPDDPLRFTLKMSETAAEYEDAYLRVWFTDANGEILGENSVRIATARSSYYRTALYDEEGKPLNDISMIEDQKTLLRPELYLVTADGEALCENVVWDELSGSGLLSIADQGDGTFLATAVGGGTGSLGIWYQVDGSSYSNWIPLIVEPNNCVHEWTTSLRAVPTETEPGAVVQTCSICGKEISQEVHLPMYGQTSYMDSDEEFLYLFDRIFHYRLNQMAEVDARSIVNFTRLFYNIGNGYMPVYISRQELLDKIDSLFAVHSGVESYLEEEDDILVDQEHDGVVFMGPIPSYGDSVSVQLLSTEQTAEGRTLHGKWLEEPGTKVRLVLDADHKIQAYEADVDEITSLTFDGLDNSGLNYSWDSIAYDHMMLYYDVFKNGEYVTGSGQGTNAKINEDTVPWYNLLSDVLGSNAGEGTYDVTVALEVYDEDDNLIARGVNSSGSFTISGFDLVSLPFEYGPEGRDVLIGEEGYSIYTNVDTRFDVAVDGLDEPVNVNVYNLVYITEIENSDPSVLSVSKNEGANDYVVKGLKAGTSQLTLHYTYRGEEKTYSYPVNVLDTYYEYKLDYEWPYLFSSYSDGQTIEMVSGEEVDVTAAISEYKYNSETESWDNMGDVTDQVEFTWTNPLYPEGDGPLQIEADGKYCKVTAKSTDVTRLAMLTVVVEKNGNRCVSRPASDGGFVAYIYKELYRQKIFVNGSEADGTGNTVPILLKEDETAEIRPEVWLDKASGVREDVDTVYCYLSLSDHVVEAVGEPVQIGDQTLMKTPITLTRRGTGRAEGYLTLFNAEGERLGFKILKFVADEEAEKDFAFMEVKTTVDYQPAFAEGTSILPGATYTAVITAHNDLAYDFDNVKPFFQMYDTSSNKWLSEEGKIISLASGETKQFTLSLTVPEGYFEEGAVVGVTAGVGRNAYSSVKYAGQHTVTGYVSEKAQDSEITVKTTGADQAFLDEYTFKAEASDLPEEAEQTLVESLVGGTVLNVDEVQTYELEFVDANGNAVPISAEDGKVFVVTIPVPEEWAEDEIGVYYYDDIAGTFEKVGSSVDTVNHTVSFTATHFSSYSVVHMTVHRHTWEDGEITKEPTCTAEGSRKRSCSDCGETEIVSIPALGHLYEAQVTPATTSEDGLVEMKCTRCGKILSTTVIPMASEIKLAAASYVYDGKVKKPAVTVKDSAGNAIDTEFYTVKYATGRKAIGQYAVTVTFNGHYSGTKELSFKIIPPATKASLANTASGVQIKWNKVSGVTGYVIYKGGKKYKTAAATSTSYIDTAAKINGTTYTYKVYAYKKVNNTNIYSKASASVKYVFLTRPTVKSAKNSASRKMTVTWNRNTKATGYQIKYVTGSTTKTVKVTSNKTVSKVISSLAKGKTYKVYVRSYKTVSGKTYYSAWSAAKSVKITK